jgi:integrase
MMLNEKANMAAGLPPGLEQLLADYAANCRENGLRESSIALCLKIDRWFLENLKVVGCENAEQIDARNVAAACLALKSNYYLSTVRTFLRALAEMGKTDRDYSGVVPSYKRPQPMPTVYSESEILEIENTIRESGSKRNYAIVLLATRLGIRSGDITGMTFGALAFECETIRILQQKTAAENEMPMIPEIKAALRDYIDNERPECDCEYVFVPQNPPHDRCLTTTRVGNMIRRAIDKSGVVRGERHGGPHGFRSSLASSMVNDGISYDAVRKALGHADPNAIKSYARLDVRRLRAYALAVPKATGSFAMFLSGKAVL